MSIPPLTSSLSPIQSMNQANQSADSQTVSQVQENTSVLETLLCTIMQTVLDDDFSSEEIEAYASSIIVDETKKEVLISSQFEDLKESLEIQLTNFGITDSDERCNAVYLLKKSYVIAHRNSPIWWNRLENALKWVPELLKISDEGAINESIRQARELLNSLTENMSLNDLTTKQKELTQCKDKLICFRELQDFLSDSDNDRICFLALNAASILYPQYEDPVAKAFMIGFSSALRTLGQKVKILEPLINEVKSLLYQIGTSQVKLTQQRASLLIEQSPSISVSSEGEKIYNQYASGVLDAFRDVLCDLFAAQVSDRNSPVDERLMNLIKEHYQAVRTNKDSLPEYVEFQKNPKVVLGSYLNQNFVIECFDKYYENDASIQLDSLAIAFLDRFSDKERAALLQELKEVGESKEDNDAKKGMIKTLIYSQMCPFVEKLGMKFSDFSGLQGFLQGSR